MRVSATGWQARSPPAGCRKRCCWKAPQASASSGWGCGSPSSCCATRPWPEAVSRAGRAGKQVELVEAALGEEMAARREKPLYEPTSGLAGHAIASVRLLLRRLALTPAIGRRKVAIIGDAERLIPQQGQEAAANALLKVLEEPPADAQLVLTASEPEALLPTILSRVVRVRLARLPDTIVTAFVQKELGVAEESIVEQQVRSADGIPGRVLAVTGDRPGADAAAGEFLSAARGAGVG